jgi:Icc-related predicted phosphoesterase
MLSDQECAALYDYYIPGRLDGYDLIISCGDLNAKYLSFIVTMAQVPVLYVHGNHDNGYSRVPPEGCDCIDDDLIVYNGLRILGLGGCKKYHDGPHQFTEAQMRKRIRKLWWKLWRHKGVDIVVTHAPPAGVGDSEDPAHRGFEAFLPLMDKYKPKYLLHGHVHLNYGMDQTRVRQYGDTQVINCCERYDLTIEDVR